MQKVSLPVTLQLMLKQHIAASDIENDEELSQIMTRLSELNEKVESVKFKARQIKQTRGHQ